MTTAARAAARRLSLAGFVAVAVVACSAPAPEPQDEEEAPALGRDTDETVFDDMLETKDRARAVEGTVMQQKRDLDAAIEASSTGEEAGSEE